jgi:hypothetical protein
MMPKATEQDIIQAYSAFRRLETPDRLESMLFLISEIGELAEAELDYQTRTGQPDETALRFLEAMANFGIKADAHVSTMKKWTRNGERTKKVLSISREVADSYMMLIKYALGAGLSHPFEELKAKMRSYGFDTETVKARISAEMHLGTPCPYCQTDLDVYTGQEAVCPGCGKKFHLQVQLIEVM